MSFRFSHPQVGAIENINCRRSLWSAATCRRFLRRGDWSPRQPRVQRGGKHQRASLRRKTSYLQNGSFPALDGDKSPAESDDKSSHSKADALPAQNH
jgi:hypothetical protein